MSNTPESTPQQPAEGKLFDEGFDETILFGTAADMLGGLMSTRFFHSDPERPRAHGHRFELRETDNPLGIVANEDNN